MRRWLVCLALSAGCVFNDNVPNARLTCRGSEDCPAGYLCTANGASRICCRGGDCGAATIVAAAPDAGAPDAPAADLVPDAAPDATPAWDPQAFEDECEHFSAAFCRKMLQCSPLVVEAGLGGPEACPARIQILCLRLFVPLRGSRSTPVQIRTCTDAIADPATPCRNLLDNPKAGSGCEDLPGELRDGEPCRSDDQCATLRCTSVEDGGSCGVCAPTVAEGQACLEDSDCKGSGIRCGPEGTCLRFGGLNDSCDEKHPCDPAYFCGTDNRCEPHRRQGAPCTGMLAESECDVVAGYLCLPTPGSTFRTCRVPTIIAPGNTCHPGEDACRGGVCSAAGKCVSLQLEGQPCNEEMNVRCLLPAECVNQVCQFPPPAQECPASPLDGGAPGG